MSPVRRCVSSMAVLVAGALLAASCSTGGGGPGFGTFGSIFDEDLAAREPADPAAAATGDVAVLGEGEAVYHGAGGQIEDETNATVSSFEPGEFNLNFQNADIREVVQSVIGNALGENYTIDPNVAGSVTISSARPIARDDLIPALEVILQMSGAALVKNGDLYRVTMEATATGGGADLGEATPGYGLTILPLRYI
jgi:general secretion pathway protein D